ncbi:MAG: 2-amino-4-oxopentanoate thiolase subunit OrtA [Thermovirgaceae bacterium]
MSDGAKRGDWVQVHQVGLKAGERAPQIPEDTARVPLEMKVKGVLVNETAKQGDLVTIETAIGRRLEGSLVAVNPAYEVGYGPPPGELRTVGNELRRFLKGEALS